MSNRSTSKKVLLSLAALGAAGAIAGLGTFATFTSTTSADQQVSSGTVVIQLGSTAETNRLTVNATNVVPGDTIQRAVDLSNTGSEALASVALTTTASPTSLLDTDATNGLQMVVERCSVPWTETANGSVYTYSCSGTTSSVLATGAVIGADRTLNNLGLAASDTNHLRVTLSLPVTAGNTFQGLTSTITYSFLGTQRTGTDR